MKKDRSKIDPGLEVKADKKVISQDKKCLRILEISITPPPEETVKAHSPLNVSLVLDRSGSMSGEKLHYVKQAAAHVIDLLDETDTASVVIYDDQVETLVPPGTLTAEFRRHAKTRIQSINSGSSTFLSGGWLKGCELVAEKAASSTINRTLLLTDGLANVGVQDIDALATHALEIFRRGVSTSCFGVGLGYDEHLLEAMANSGGGNFHFLETMNAIPLVFEREFKDLVDIGLRDVEVSIPLPDGVKASVLAGWPVESTGGLLKIAVGSLYSGRTQRIYLKLEFKKGLSGSKVSLPVTVSGKDKAEHINTSVATIAFKLVPASEEISAVGDRPLLERFAAVDLADKASEALKKERAGDRAGATRTMQGSVRDNRVYMSAPQMEKFRYLSEELSAGMDEGSRKRHHQEEYENKRGRAAERDYRLQMVNGHLITNIEGLSVLVDTGVPISIGKPAEFYFLNELHPLSKEYLGVTLDYLEKMVGTPIELLMGMDILKKYCLTIDLPGNRITFSARATFQPLYQVPMTSFMGVPSATFSVDGADRQMFVDTGAKLSYVDAKIAAHASPTGKEMDFYPGMGEFETLVYAIPFQAGKLSFQLRCGVLPDLLATNLQLTGMSGILGSEIFQKFLVCLAFPQEMILLDNIK